MIPEVSPQKYAELESEFGNLYAIPTHVGTFLVKRPSRHEFKRALKKLRAQDVDAEEELSIACVVWPERAGVAELFDRFPGLPAVVSDTLVDIAKGDESSRAKKPSTSGAVHSATPGSPESV